MKRTLTILLCLASTLAQAEFSVAINPNEPDAAKKERQERRAERRKGGVVYKGIVAQRVRFSTNTDDVQASVGSETAKPAKPAKNLRSKFHEETEVPSVMLGNL